MIDSQIASALSSLTKNTSIQPVTVLTSLRYSEGLLKAFNNLTFIYDDNWSYTKGNPTYPIAFFFVKSMQEIMASNISQRPMLFYNSGADSTDSTKGGIMNIVADNIITQPKEYKLDLLVPANGTKFMSTAFSVDSLYNVTNFVTNQGSTSNQINALHTACTWEVDIGIKATTDLLEALYGTEIGASSILNMLLRQQDYNKASLEDMWRNRRIIKMKLWNGWNFKYLVIKNLDITKTGDEEGFYTADLTCQEVPIMTFRRQASNTSLSILSGISSVLGSSMKLATKAFINIMSASLK